MEQHNGGAEELRSLVAAQQRQIERLLARVDELERRRHDDGSATSTPNHDDSASADGATGRRQLLKGLVAGAAATGASVLATSSPAAAASGTFDGNPAVKGTCTTNGRGVWGIAQSGIGVLGQTEAGGQGVRGESGTGVGVYAQGGAGGLLAVSQTAGGYGLRASSSNGGVSGVFTSSYVQMRLERLGAGVPTPTATAVSYTTGDLVFDSVGDLWFCVAGGNPGTWRRLGGASTVGGLTVLPSAIRAYDSRAGQSPSGVAKGQLASGQERTVDLKVGGGVPAGATAALLNVTVTGTSPAGFLKLFKPGAAVPSASAINWFAAGSNLANNCTVAVSATAGVTVRCGGTGASTDVIIDVVGYYR